MPGSSTSGRGRRALASADDTVLVERARAGDAEALEVLLERHFDFVHGVCRSILWRPQDSDALEAARQTALLQLARGIGRFEGRSKFTTWAFPIARNAALAQQRGRPPESEPLPDEAVSRSDDPGETVTMRLALDQCLDHLPAAYRDAVMLRIIGGLEYQQIAERLDIVIGTVKQRISRGRQALRQCLSERGIER